MKHMVGAIEISFGSEKLTLTSRSNNSYIVSKGDAELLVIDKSIDPEMLPTYQLGLIVASLFPFSERERREKVSAADKKAAIGAIKLILNQGLTATN